MEEKICVSCQKVNDARFTYCKYCGAMLPVVDRAPRAEELPPEEKQELGGISYWEYHRYIGPNADSILDEFARLENGSARFIMSIPVLLLGMFFGFYGMSAWFFYRKMKKQGVALLIIGVIFTVVDGLLNGSLNQMFSEQLYYILGNGSSFTAIAEQLSTLITYYSYQLIGISSHISFLSSFFVAFYAMGAYKRKSHKDIIRIKEGFDSEGNVSLDLLLKKCGHTSLALAVIPFAVSAVLPLAVFAITII